MHRLPPVKTIFQRLIFSTTKAPGHENQVVNDQYKGYTEETLKLIWEG